MWNEFKITIITKLLIKWDWRKIIKKKHLGWERENLNSQFAEKMINIIWYVIYCDSKEFEQIIIFIKYSISYLASSA
jgi:hypothetical protein